jgi:pimeloyl-ACP methyl ester carboxylesterase
MNMPSWDFFISYSRADLAWAEWVAWQLENAGYRVHFQEWDLVPGTHQMTGMDEGVRHASHTIAIVSRAYHESVFGAAQWRAAFRADPDGFTRRLIPIRVEACDQAGLLDGVVPIDLVGLAAVDAEAVLLAKIEASLAGRAKPSAPPSYPDAGNVGRRPSPPAGTPGLPPSSDGAHTSPTVTPFYPGRTNAEIAAGSRIVLVHGIGLQISGEHSLHAIWFPALADGVLRAGGRVTSGDVGCAFYGDLFRGQARLLGVGEQKFAELSPDEAAGLVAELHAKAAQVDAEVTPPDAETLGTPRIVQSSLRTLLNSRTFCDLTMRTLTGSLRQLRQYLTDQDVRADILARVEQAVGPSTRILIGHSLGSVIAYEALCAHPDWPVRHLITLGSPLGTRFVRDGLKPDPRRGRRKADRRRPWPGPVVSWTNFAGEGDVVAMEKNLCDFFDGPIMSFEVDTGRHAHDAVSYLTSKDVGKAVLRGLA